MSFEGRFCGTCAKWDSTVAPEGYEIGCPIQLAANVYDPDEDGDAYPKEWVTGGELGPRCTAYEQRNGYDADARPAPRCKVTLDLFGER